MKKTILTLVCCATFSVSAQNGGFIGPGSKLSQAQITTSAQAKTLPDDSNVMLEGNILRQIDKDHYEFRDTSGTLTVEIDYDKWQGQTIKPDDNVRLEGKIDKNAQKTELDVKRIMRQ